jgi:hypothetical protein
MRLLKIQPCRLCQGSKEPKIFMDLTDDADKSLPLHCSSHRCTEGAKLLEVCEVPEHPIAEILAKLTIEHYPLKPLTPVGPFVLEDFEVEEPEPGFKRVTVKLSGGKHPEFKVQYSWERNPLYQQRDGVDIQEGTIPHLAWQAVDFISHHGHTKTQRGQNGWENWVYLEGYGSESVSKGGTRYRTRARVTWPKG